MFKITCENGSGPISLMIKEKHTSFPWKILRLGYKSPPAMDNGRHRKDVGSSNISISKKHLKFIKTTTASTKGSEEAAACGRRMIQRHNPPHTPAKDISTCSPYRKRTQKGRSGSGAWKLCSWVRRLLFPLCFLQMACSDSAILCCCQAKCLPQNHPTTLCHMPHSRVLKSSTSIHHRYHSILWMKCRPPKMWYMTLFIMRRESEYFFYTDSSR